MARVDKEYELRMQGMLYALEVAKNKGVEALEKEVKMRGVTRAEITCKEEKVREMYQMMSQNVYINMLTVICWTLKENFGFGKQRLQKLKTAFDANAQIIQDLDYMGQHYVQLQDFAFELNNKYDLGLDIERIAACEDDYDKRDDRRKYCEIKRVLEILRMNGYRRAAAFLEEKTVPLGKK